MPKSTLKTAIRTEIYKALHNKMFLSAIAIGLLLCGLDLWENYLAIQEAIETVISAREWGYDAGLGYSVFYSWLGYGSCTYSGSLFYTVWPVLAAMAFGWSYNNERFSGIYDQIVVRSGIHNYCIAKHTAVFISGGLAIALPMLLNLLGLTMIYPSNFGGGQYNMYFFYQLAFASPWAYSLLWCFIIFLFGGATACVCHVAGTYLRHGVIVILVPYAIYIVIDSLTTALRSTLGSTNIYYVISPYRMLYACPGACNPGWLLFGTVGLLTLGSYFLGYWQVKKNELV